MVIFAIRAAISEIQLILALKGKLAYTPHTCTLLPNILTKIQSEDCIVPYQTLPNLSIEIPVRLPANRRMLKQPLSHVFHPFNLNQNILPCYTGLQKHAWSTRSTFTLFYPQNISEVNKQGCRFSTFVANQTLLNHWISL